MEISSEKTFKNSPLSRRNFLKGTAVVPLLSLAASQSAEAAESKLTAAISNKAAKILIVGAGTGGIDAAARLRRAAPKAKITVVAPNDVHLYQSGQVFVAAGLYTQADNRCDTSKLIPDGVEWLQDRVTAFDPDHNSIMTEKKGEIPYDVLVVAAGAEHDFASIEGLSIDDFGRNGIASVYLNDIDSGKVAGGEQVRQWFEQIAQAAQAKEQTILFTIPQGDVKAENATLDILMLGLEILRGKGPGQGPDVSDRISLILAVGNDHLIASKAFDAAVQKILRKEKRLKILFDTQLKQVDPAKKTATLQDKNGESSLRYDFLHVAPPIKAPDPVASSKLALAEGVRKGFVEVDPVTLQHKRYPNVFALGDVAALPAKSGAATRDMAIVIQDNVANALEGRKLSTRYTGYTAAPFKPRFGREMLIEYDRKGPSPTFPLDPTVPRWIWWEVDLHLLRWVYFDLIMHGML